MWGGVFSHFCQGKVIFHFGQGEFVEGNLIFFFFEDDESPLLGGK